MNLEIEGGSGTQKRSWNQTGRSGAGGILTNKAGMLLKNKAVIWMYPPSQNWPALISLDSAITDRPRLNSEKKAAQPGNEPNMSFEISKCVNNFSGSGLCCFAPIPIGLRPVRAEREKTPNSRNEPIK
jgi:hypothetical protein